jgi:hypothetical protein
MTSFIAFYKSCIEIFYQNLCIKRKQCYPFAICEKDFFFIFGFSLCHELFKIGSVYETLLPLWQFRFHLAGNPARN